MPMLKNWSVTTFEESVYLAPEQRCPRLHGEVYGHAMFPDGASITTSPMVSRRGDIVTTQSGSEYELGDVNPAYEAAYPNARERVCTVKP